MFQELLTKLAQALDVEHLPYMIIGGQAVLVYGEPRLTRDIDVTLGVTADDVARALRVAQAIGAAPLVEDVPAFVRQTMVLPCQHSATGIRVDFIFSFSPYERQAIERAQGVVIGSTIVRVASLEDLIIHKIVAGRARDLEDVRRILLKNPQADIAYIRQWLREFQQALSRPLIRQFNKLWMSTRPG
jgi:hypothetical protein